IVNLGRDAANSRKRVRLGSVMPRLYLLRFCYLEIVPVINVDMSGHELSHHTLKVRFNIVAHMAAAFPAVLAVLPIGLPSRWVNATMTTAPPITTSPTRVHVDAFAPQLRK